MRAVVQRVSAASVSMAEKVTSSMGRGLVVLLGIEPADTAEDVGWLAGKLVHLRLFPKPGTMEGAWDFNVREAGGDLLLISQFTLFASTKKGTRPSWHRAAAPDIAMRLYEALVRALNERMARPIQTGCFGAMMQVTLVNDGPVTLIIDSRARE